ncbi:MAG: 2-dehydro-3-deoxy-6-phosphogalactonate aldolase [Granulicella sp.]
MDINAWLNRCPIVAILRGIRPEEAESICAALEEAGIAIVEVPLNSPDALSSISILSKVFGERMLIGAGTLTDPKQVAEVAAAGGRLIVTPHADTEIVRAAKAMGLFAVPGFFNPTEAFALLHAGADAIKLFPSEVVGIPMLKALQAVLPKGTVVIPVGGIDANGIATWMGAGALGVGVGSSIYKPGDSAAIAGDKAKALVGAFRSYERSRSIG